MQIKNSIFCLALVGALAVPGLSSAVVVPDCDVMNATANGEENYADECRFTSDDVNGSSAENDQTEAWFGEGFLRVGKYEDGTGFEAGDLDGFELIVTKDGYGDDFKFAYQLIVPEAWVGQVVDWVLTVKQASDSYVGYLFNDVTLGIEGGFNNFWLNRGGQEVNDYSFAAGWIRPTTATVPEPGTLGLIGLGLLGLGLAARRRISR